LGYVLFAQQKIGESIRELAHSLRLNIRNAEAHKILGRVLMIIGRYDRARTEFEQAARLKPESAEIRYNLGKLYSAQDDFPAARREFDQALRLDASYMEAYNALGFAMESMSKDAEALEHYRKAIALNEERGAGFISPYVNLAAYYNRLNEAAPALEHASRALEIDPRSDLALFQAAKAYRAEKKWEEATAALEKAISINARISRYHYVLGLLYRRLGEEEKSRQALDKFELLEAEAVELETKRREAKSGSE
jgi:Flp pilus assembly protein TadD